MDPTAPADPRNLQAGGALLYVITIATVLLGLFAISIYHLRTGSHLIRASSKNADITLGGRSGIRRPAMVWREGVTVVLLLVAAVEVWGYRVFQFLGAYLGREFPSQTGGFTSAISDRDVLGIRFSLIE